MSRMENEQEQVTFEGGQLTALSVQKGNPDRLSLFVDERFAFGVRREVAYRHRLKKGMEVSSELLLTVWRDEESYRARDLAAMYLGRRARSSKEMGDYLLGKEFDEVVVAETIAWLERYGYLNDSQFAKQWVENRMKYRPRGKAMLRWELQQKGVRGTDIDAAFEDELGDGETEVEAAVVLLGKKIGRKQLEFTYEEQAKLAQFLMRRGFSSSIARESLRIFRQRANLDND
ncbi:MAG: regulatory protein RecX [Tumebacillaceae bacterium]